MDARLTAAVGQGQTCKGGLGMNGDSEDMPEAGQMQRFVSATAGVECHDP